jgi:hypothetical protein
MRLGVEQTMAQIACHNPSSCARYLAQVGTMWHHRHRFLEVRRYEVKSYRILLVGVVLLLMTTPACVETGSGYSKSHTSSGNRGHIEVSVVESVRGENTILVEINEDSSYSDNVKMTVTLQVGSGSCQAKLLDGNKDVVLTLEAKPGQPDKGTVTLETDEFGDVYFKVQGSRAKLIDITIDYEKQ